MSINVNTTDRGDGQSNLDPIAVVFAPSGASIGRGDDEVPCTFQPVCGFACPSITVSLPVTGRYTVLIVDSDDEVCTGGDYAAIADGSAGLTLAQDDVILGGESSSLASRMKLDITQ